MSLQVCSCCGSKVTTYQGLRIHQGKMGCTQRAMSILQTEQFSVPSLSYSPELTNMGRPGRVEEPLMDVFTPSIKSDPSSDIALRICHCGWRKVTSPLGVDIHQLKTGCMPKETATPEREQYNSINQLEDSHWKDSGPINSTPVKKESAPMPSHFSTTTIPPAVLEFIKSLIETSQQTATDKTHQAFDFDSGTQPLVMPVSQTYSTTTKLGAAAVKVKETNQPLFETPPRYYETATKTRRALDFSTGAEQVRELVWEHPTFTAQEPVVRPKDKERRKERESQLLRARQDRIRADLQKKIQMREQKMAEIRSSVKACKGSLDAEWLEINDVFTELMQTVEDAWQEALQPLEDRRHEVKSQARDLVEKLQQEIDKLKQTIDELDNKPDLQVSSLTGLNESQDWENAAVDTSLSFGTLRTATSNMMAQISQKVEKLSSFELKRIRTFAVDVTLDPTTAHHHLVVSPDGKTVRDGGKNQDVPDSPERFDMFGSILGLSSLNHGKSYWEVEVGNKTGWDLGVARRDANRRGKLSMNPDNGYWVTVHYEDEKYAAMSAPPAGLSLRVKPKKVGVFVDYEEGLVSFYDVAAQSHIYSFTDCSFSDEIVPYFSPHLKENEKNSHPLVISAVAVA